VSDVTTKIQIWNASTNRHVGHTAYYPIMTKGVTCHTDPWKSESSIHVVIKYIMLLKYVGIAYHKLDFWFHGTNPGSRISCSCSTSGARHFGLATTWWSVINEEITFPCYVVMCICMFTDILRYIPDLINYWIQLFIYLTSITYSQGPYCRRSSIWHTTKYTWS
jgi:hypothetical protein